MAKSAFLFVDFVLFIASKIRLPWSKVIIWVYSNFRKVRSYWKKYELNLIGISNNSYDI